MAKTLQKYFPQTFLLLTDAQKTQILRNFSQDHCLPEDLRYFPMKLKEMKWAENIVQTADYEFLRHWVAEAEGISLRAAGAYHLNSTLQWVVLEGAAPFLQKEKGLYALWKFQGEIKEKILSQAEAQVLHDIQDHPEFFNTTPETDQVLKDLVDQGLLSRTSFSPSDLPTAGCG